MRARRPRRHPRRRKDEARLAEYLIGRADARHRAVIAIGMTQQQLAEELGTVREVVVRELQALRASGLLRALGSGRFEIVDATALRARAREGAGRSRKVKVERRDTADAT
ncbi:MAG: winged helix-turn-helix domain-containing protein [Gemmatimonadetes bacterium]|nr:winged helix-turn-helix domain-containing protein [Gemmatimonadota bacterium]